MLPFWNLQKILITFRIGKPTLARSLKFPCHGFCKAIRKCKKEANTSKYTRHLLELASSYMEIVSSNDKEHIK